MKSCRNCKTLIEPSVTTYPQGTGPRRAVETDSRSLMGSESQRRLSRSAALHRRASRPVTAAGEHDGTRTPAAIGD